MTWKRTLNVEFRNTNPKNAQYGETYHETAYLSSDGLWAIWRGKNDLWAMTHRPTQFNCTMNRYGYDKLKDAKGIIDYLTALGDWSFTDHTTPEVKELLTRAWRNRPQL